MSNLERMFQSFQRKWPGTERTGFVRDGFGCYAYEIKRPNGKTYFFCAKQSMKGAEVSMHKELVHRSNAKSIPIILMLSHISYLFYGTDILKSKPYMNIRNNAEMLNFPLNLGRNLETVGRKLTVATEDDMDDLKAHPVGRVMVEQLGLEIPS